MRLTNRSILAAVAMALSTSPLVGCPTADPSRELDDASIGDQYGDGAPDILIGQPVSSSGPVGGLLSLVSSEHL